jgi:hypothetical protein
MNEYTGLVGKEEKRSYGNIPSTSTKISNSVLLQRMQTKTPLRKRSMSEKVYKWLIHAKTFLTNPMNHGLGLSVVFLVLSTTVERVAFKMGVDNMTPFRMFLSLAFVAVSFLVYALVATYKVLRTDQITPRMWQFPKLKLLTMASIDAVSFTGLVISAAGVTPTMTVILLHASTPVVVFMSRLVFPNRNYSPTQLRGSWFICLAIGISITRSLMEFYNGTELTSALCSILYTACAALHGFGTLYKEKAIVEWSQQLDVHFLSAGLFFFQFLAMTALSPLLYHFQGVSSAWGDYPLTWHDFTDNIAEGWQCLFQLGALQLNRHTCPPQSDTDCGCDGSFFIVLAYVLANVTVLECIGNVLQTSNALLGRAMTMSVLIAFIALGVYDNTMDSDVYIRIFGTIGYADILSMVALLIGIDYNGRDAEPNVEMITTYDPVEDENEENDDI